MPHVGGVISGGTANLSESSGGLGSIYDEYMNAMSGDLRDETNRLMREEAEKDRLYQTESAKTAMDFERVENEKNRAFQQESADKSMAFEKAEAELQRKWLEEMSNSSYTRAVADMKNAGLNPILLASKGFSGASTPSVGMPGGSQASGSSASGFSSRGSKASVDNSSYVVNALTSMFNSAANLLGSVFRVNSTVTSSAVRSFSKSK